MPNPIIYLFFIAPPIAAAFLTPRRKSSPLPPMLFLTAPAILSLFYNRFATVVIFAPILLLLPWMPYLRKRLSKSVLLFAGLSMFILLLASFGERIFLGHLITRYVLLGVAYGQFHSFGNMLTAMTGAAMLYLLRHYIVHNPES